MILPSQRFREDLNAILNSALLSVKPETLLKSRVSLDKDILRILDEEFYLPEYRNIHMIGIGKGALSLYKVFSDISGYRTNRGIIISSEEYYPEIENVEFIRGDHPVPGKNSLKSAEKLKLFIKGINENDLVIVLLTGGASSMAVSPPRGYQ